MEPGVLCTSVNSTCYERTFLVMSSSPDLFVMGWTYSCRITVKKTQALVVQRGDDQAVVDLGLHHMVVHDVKA